MKFRIGYGGPPNYPHGQRGTQGRGSPVSELERLVQLIISLQILFGSRRGGILFPLLIIGVIGGGWFVYQQFFSVQAELRRADTLWDSGDSANRNAAVLEYKSLLQKRNDWNVTEPALQQERDRLYRRIIQHHVLFDLNQDDARDWIKNAWDERYKLRDMNFGDPKVIEYWNEVVDQLKRGRGKFSWQPFPRGPSQFAPVGRPRCQWV